MVVVHTVWALDPSLTVAPESLALCDSGFYYFSSASVCLKCLWRRYPRYSFMHPSRFACEAVKCVHGCSSKFKCPWSVRWEWKTPYKRQPCTMGQTKTGWDEPHGPDSQTELQEWVRNKQSPQWRKVPSSNLLKNLLGRLAGDLTVAHCATVHCYLCLCLKTEGAPASESWVFMCPIHTNPNKLAPDECAVLQWVVVLPPPLCRWSCQIDGSIHEGTMAVLSLCTATEPEWARHCV